MSVDTTRGRETQNIPGANLLREITDHYFNTHPIARSYYDGIFEGFNPFCDIPEELSVRYFGKELEKGVFAMGIDPDNRSLALQRKTDISPGAELTRFRRLIPLILCDPTSTSIYDPEFPSEFAHKLISFLPHEFIHYQLNVPILLLRDLLNVSDLRDIGQFSSFYVFNELIVGLCVSEVLGIPWEISILDYKKYFTHIDYQMIVGQTNDLIRVRSIKVTKQNKQNVFRKWMGKTDVGIEFDKLVKVIARARARGIHPIDIGKVINYAVFDFIKSRGGSDYEVNFSSIASSIEFYIKKGVLHSRLPPCNKIYTNDKVSPLVFQNHYDDLVGLAKLHMSAVH